LRRACQRLITHAGESAAQKLLKMLLHER
jgi:hypothetical protein